MNSIKVMNYVIITIVGLFISLHAYNIGYLQQSPVQGGYLPFEAIPETVLHKIDWLEKIPMRYRKQVEHYCRETKVPVKLVYRIVKSESNWKNNAYNKNTCGSVDRGLFQLNSKYVEWFGKKFAGHRINAYNSDHSIKTGIRYIAWLLKQFDGNVEKAVASYNWGIGNVNSGRAYPNCVKNYVKKVCK